MATPSEEPAGAIADGTPKTEATVVECKSFTGAVALLAGGVIEAVCQRQHLKNPDSHIAEDDCGRYDYQPGVRPSRSPARAAVAAGVSFAGA